MKRVGTSLVVGGVLILLVGVWAYKEKHFWFQDFSPVVVAPPVEELKLVLKDVLAGYRVSWERKRNRQPGGELWQVHVPDDVPVPSLHLAVQESVARVGARVLFAESEPVSGRVSLRIGWQDSCFFRVELVPLRGVRRDEGRIALLIDDFGDRWDGFVESFLELGEPITISVIPGRQMSSRVAQEAAERGCEVVLHLPMEPLYMPYQDDGYIVLTTMAREQVRRVVQRALDDVPGAVGVNNHMGSRVTADRRTMTEVLEEVKARGLYFVDSRTTAASVAYEVARELGLWCGQRDLFLDAEGGKAEVREKFWGLARKARAAGSAIGIGHCQRMTLEVLREEMPRIQAEGFRFVPLSEVVK